MRTGRACALAVMAGRFGGNSDLRPGICDLQYHRTQWRCDDVLWWIYCLRCGRFVKPVMYGSWAKEAR